MGKSRNMALGELVLDFDVYPRSQVDSTWVGRLVEAIRAGEAMPPIVICRATKRVVDGFHRYKAYSTVYGADAPVTKVPVVEVDYESDSELFLDAARRNARHGHPLTPFDLARIAVQALNYGVEVETIAAACGIRRESLEKRLATRVATVKGDKVVLKTTIAHLAGRPLSAKQVEGNRGAGGMQQRYYVNQVKNLLENDLVDWDNGGLVEGLRALQLLLNEALKDAAA